MLWVWSIVGGLCVFAIFAFALRSYMNWMGGRVIKRVLRQVETGPFPALKSGPRKNYTHKITFGEEGFDVLGLKGSNPQSFSAHWDDVVKIEVFKRDLIAVDLMCIAVSLKNDQVLELDEDMEGFSELNKALPLYLEGCEKWDDWFMAVAFPAFATNLREIFHRKQGKEAR